MRKIKIIFITILLLAIGSSALLVGLYVFTPVVDNAILKLINRYAGEDWQVDFDALSGNLFGTIRLDNLRVIHHSDSINVARVELDYRLLDVLRQNYHVRSLNLQQPRVKWHLALPDSPATPSPPLDSLLAALDPGAFPAVTIDKLTLTDGQVMLVQPDTTQYIRDIQLNLGAAVTPQRIFLQPTVLSANWDNRSLQLEHLLFRLEGDWDALELSNFSVAINGMRAAGSGKATRLPHLQWEFQLQQATAIIAELNGLGMEVPYSDGGISLSGQMAGTASSLSGQMAASGALDSLEIAQLAASIDYRQNAHWQFRDIELRSNFGNVNGYFELANEGRNAVDVRFSELNLKQLGIADVNTRLNGRINLQYSGDSFEEISGRGSAVLYNLAYDKMRVDTVALRLSASNGNWRIEEPSVITVAKYSRFELSGTLRRNKQLDVTLVTDRNSLDSLAQRLAVENIGGAGSMTLNLTGSLDDPSVNGNIYLDSLTTNNTIIYGIYGDANIRNIFSKRLGNFDLELATGYVGDIFLTSGKVNLRFEGNTVFFDPFQFYSEENSIETAGQLSFDEKELSLSLSMLRLAYERYRINNQTPLNASLFNGDSLVIAPFTMVSADTGIINTEGTLLFRENANSELHVQLENIPLAPFNEYLYWQHKLKGVVNSRVDLYGALNNPEIDITISLDELRIDENEIGKVYGDFTIAEKRLSINVITFDGPNESYLDINGNIELAIEQVDEQQELEVARDIPLGFNVVFGNFRLQDYNFLYETTYPVAGAVTGRLDINGSWLKPEADLTLDGQDIQYGDYEFPALSMKAQMQPDNLVIEEATVNFLNTIVNVRGEKRLRWNPDNLDSLFADKYLELYVDIEEDSLNFLSAVNPELERIIGKIKVNSVLKGDYDAPQFETLDIDIKDGKLYLSKIENSIDAINARAHLEGTRLNIETFTARSPKPRRTGNFLQRWFNSVKSIFIKEKERGEIRGQGWVDFADITRPQLDISVFADHAFFNYFLENTRVVVNTRNLRVTGRDTLLVSGDVEVVEGEVEFDFVESEKNLLFETTVREEPPFVTYNLNVEISQNFTIRSYEALNNFDINLEGEIRVTSRPRSELEIYGSLTTSGKYYIQGEDFDIENGKIEFVNPKELPELNLTARTYKKDQVNNQQLTFLLNVRGKIDQPEKEIIIQDEQGNVLNYDVKDQLALLLFGMTFDQLGGSDAQDLLLSRGEQVLTQALVSSIEREARTFTGLDQIRLEQQDSFFSNRLNRPSTLSLGKYLTPNLYLEYRSQLASSGLGNVPAPQLSWEAGNQIYLQYRLNRHWSFSTIYQKTLEGNNRVQFDINWQTGF